MTLIAILVGTLLAGIGSVWLAAALSFGALARYTQHMLSMAAGALLSTALLHLLIGVLFFFLLDKAELWHHGHEHHHSPEGGHDHPVQLHDHHHGHDHGHG